MWSDNPADPNSPQSPYSGVVATSILLTGQVRVYGWTAYSTKGTAQYILLFDASSLPANGKVPIIAAPIGANNLVGAYYGPMGRVFHQGFVLCNSSTDSTKTIGSADCLFDVQLDYLI